MAAKDVGAQMCMGEGSCILLLPWSNTLLLTSCCSRDVRERHLAHVNQFGIAALHLPRSRLSRPTGASKPSAESVSRKQTAAVGCSPAFAQVEAALLWLHPNLWLHPPYVHTTVVGCSLAFMQVAAALLWIHPNSGSLFPACTLQLWDVETGMERASLLGHKAEIVSLNFNTTDMNIRPGHHQLVVVHNFPILLDAGDLIITGSFDHDSRIWDVRTGRCVHTLSGHRGEVSSTQFNHAGKLLVLIRDKFLNQSIMSCYKNASAKSIHENRVKSLMASLLACALEIKRHHTLCDWIARPVSKH
eukprot:scaffold115389_cov22-Tisochrysis_lutea.AAC.4